MIAPAPSPGVLERIVARTRHDVQRREQRVPMAHLEEGVGGDTRDLHAALAAPDLGLIAEYKPRSPSRGVLRADAVPERFAHAYRPYAAAISVLCDEPFFGGSREALSRMRAACELPVLCKDFIVTRYQVVEARAAGADAVLLMASLLPLRPLRALRTMAADLGMASLVEAHDEAEVDRALEAGARIVGVNSRDLRTLDVDLERIERLAARVPADVLRVGESGVHAREDVERLRGRVHALLVGTELMTSPRPEARIEALGWSPCR